MEKRSQKVRGYIQDLFCKESPELQFVRMNSKKMGLREVYVPPVVGKKLHLFTKLINPRRVLEIGTLGGYSTIWIAQALSSDAKMVSIELNEKNVKVALEHLFLAKLDTIVEIRQGDASFLLSKMVEEKEEPFDLIFIDADKKNYSLYLDLALQLAKKGSLILTDNLIPKRGEILKPDKRDKEATCIYEFNQKLANHPKLETVLIPILKDDESFADALGFSIVQG
ncbi:MAG: O-methyltransferase [Chlamydiae bacterium]|nr:O-methyltransferase [Chlamydiota bacterium]